MVDSLPEAGHNSPGLQSFNAIKNEIQINESRFLNGFFGYKVPLLACSRSIDSNKALKLPAPKPLAPMRWMIS
jgi:hypothetical protein